MCQPRGWLLVQVTTRIAHPNGARLPARCTTMACCVVTTKGTGTGGVGVVVMSRLPEQEVLDTSGTKEYDPA
jgi:hypothetical protein